MRKEITLNGSKSIVNRLMIIHALCEYKEDLSVASNANDTLVLQRALKFRSEPIIDIEDAGTACRFMTAFLALYGDNNVLVGSRRMSERPIEPLVSALNNLGANISYVGKEGFLPLKFNNGYDKMSGGRVYLRADISSQFVSALIMVAPFFKNGLEMILEGDVVSRPYIDMTLKIMEQFGILYIANESVIKIPNQEYDLKPFIVEGDWSAASYFYSLLCLSPHLKEIKINGLHKDSIQGDIEIHKIMEHFGVQTLFTPSGIVIKKITDFSFPSSFLYDFTSCPDLAQTCMVLVAALNIPSTFTGLTTLRNKETDRLVAMKTELESLGAKIDISDSDFVLQKGIKKAKTAKGKIQTYKDHRIAMSFAPLMSTTPTLVIENPSVVSKSYPDFWRDFDSLNKQ